ncbi:unnamed protein product, partial [Leptidea sinapis]
MDIYEEYSWKFNNLPDELIISIFKYLSIDDLLTCKCVCVKWRKLSLDPMLWRRLLIVYSGKPGQSEVNEKSLRIIKLHPNLVYCLKIQYEYNYSIIQSMMAKCKNIISFEVVVCRIKEKFKDDIKKWPHLKKLNLKNTMPFEAITWTISFDHFKELKYIALAEFGLNSSNCETLLDCTCLTHINIEKIKDLELDFIKKLIDMKQSKLETLHIYGGSSVDDSCLQDLTKCPKLKDLAILRCENLTNRGLIHLANLNHIERLQIWNNNNFTEIMLLKTLQSPNLITLKSLSMSRIKHISPAAIDTISEHYKNLKFLALYQCPREKTW